MPRLLGTMNLCFRVADHPPGILKTDAVDNYLGLLRGQSRLLENVEENLTPRMRNLIAMMWSEWKELELQLEEMNAESSGLPPAMPHARDCDRFRASNLWWQPRS